MNRHIALKVFDVNGREVATLVDENSTVGEHHVKFAPRGLSAGIYFCRITAEKFSAPRKLLLVR